LSGKKKRKDFSTKIYGLPKEWNKEFKRFVGSHGRIKALNNQLKYWETKMNHTYWQLYNVKGEVELDEFFFRLTGRYSSPTFLATFKKRIEEIEQLIGKGYSKGTIDIYKRAMGWLKRYITSKGKEDVLLRHINQGFLKGYFEFLRQSMGVNAANKYMRKINAVLNYAEANDLLERGRAPKFSIKDEKTQPVYLTEEELQTIMDKEISIKRLAVVRDVFVFMCHTSMAYADIKSLKPEHIQTEDGKKFVLKPRQKTNIEMKVPVLHQTDSILAKYHGQQPSGKCFPVPSSQKDERLFARVGNAICGIDKHLTSHVGRHTFATMMLNKGMRA
jgi:integrase